MTYKWIAKALVQKAISILPYKNRINFFFQKYVTKGVRLTDDFFSDRLTHARNHIKFFRTSTGFAYPNKAMELGTGWYPVIPIYIFLTGGNEIWSIDIAMHLKGERIVQTARMYYEKIQNGQLSISDEGFLPDRIEVIKDIALSSNYAEMDLLNKLNLFYWVGDARRTNFCSEYFDLIHSNNTFEHIYPKVLREIVREMDRVLVKGGIMSHFIDLSDHFAHFDNSITIYNFLRFSDIQWKMIDNSIQPQNRLRVNDYMDLLNEVNLKFNIEEKREGDPIQLRRIKLNHKFTSYSPQNLLVSHCHFVIKK
jgi:hypothetical protein